MASILIVDDEIGIRELLCEILHDEGHDVLQAENATAAREARARARPDLVLLDIWMPDTDGITLLKEWSGAGQLTMPVIMMSGHGTIDTAVEATRIGALDFLEKPIAMQKLLAAVKRGLARTPASAPPELTLDAFGRVGALRSVKRRLEQVAEKCAVVLLRTPPGGIVDLCARALQPAGAAWIDLSTHVNPLELSALEKARGAVLFAPELGELSRLQQRNLVFALERLERHGQRIVVATRHEPDELIRMGWEEAPLRRLFEVRITLPALAELRDDIPDLAARLLQHLAEVEHAPGRALTPGALHALRGHSWPGGYAELRAAMRSLALGALAPEIGEQDVRQFLGPLSARASHMLPLDLPLREAREAFERMYFEHHLRLDSGNMTRLAEKAGLERTHLYRKLKALGIHVGRRAEDADASPDGQEPG
ncbi:MAG: sigma-54-dependent Fis family transcriptional regulator [Betaproteobacteria bacterium]|nr:sigma-54-dependent Fis family transcriptional regulator [Betaproteobacteria bacterium]